MERIEIYTSKKKNIFLLFLTIIFFAIGLFCFLNANGLSKDSKRSIVFIEAIGIIVIHLKTLRKILSSFVCLYLYQKKSNEKNNHWFISLYFFIYRKYNKKVLKNLEYNSKCPYICTRKIIYIIVIAGVAQLVERQPSKLNVASSNLVSRSIKKEAVLKSLN